MATRVAHDALRSFVATVYEKGGLPPRDAHLVADTLVQADLWGHQSHGVLRLGWYLDRIRNGVMKPVTEPEFVVDAGSVAVVDGHDGVGPVIAELATREAIRRAKAHGRRAEDGSAGGDRRDHSADGREQRLRDRNDGRRAVGRADRQRLSVAGAQPV